jgi:hypothetical protein
MDFDRAALAHRTSIYPGTVVARATMEMKF